MRHYLRQQPDKAAFEEFLWSRPERRADQGVLVIIGGHAYYSAAPVAAHSEALAANAGEIKVILPDQLKKLLPDLANDPGMYFVQTNQSGSFGAAALHKILDIVAGSDCVVMAGDFGRSSETMLMVEDLLSNYTHQIVLTGDVADQICSNPGTVLDRQNTTMVLTFKQLQTLAARKRLAKPFLSQEPAPLFADKLADFADAIMPSLVVHHSENFWVASEGQVSATFDPDNMTETGWRSQLAGICGAFLAANPSSEFEALTSAVYKFKN